MRLLLLSPGDLSRFLHGVYPDWRSRVEGLRAVAQGDKMNPLLFGKILPTMPSDAQTIHAMNEAMAAGISKAEIDGVY